MKELHAWAPWFRALSRKIAGGGEEYLIEKAKAVTWKKEEGQGQAEDKKSRPPLLRESDQRIDPFSFLYTLASKNTRHQRPVAYPSVDKIFGVESVLPDPKDPYLFVFPKPTWNVLFSPSGEHFDLLWRLFRQAAADEDSIVTTDYEATLAIDDVASKKLSHVLFLSNPYRFLPVDNFGLLSRVPTLAEDSHTYEDYAAACDYVRQCFPGCQPFEINYFLFYQSFKKGWFGKRSSVFHVNTNLLNDREDFWPEFEENNAVRTGGIASGVAWNEDLPPNQDIFPLSDAKNGDVVLVHYGVDHGQAIGVVGAVGDRVWNDFAQQDGLNAQSRIHVSWINKASSNLAGQTESLAFNVAGHDSSTYRAFSRTAAYRPTFDLLDSLIPPNDMTHQHHPLNQILYGPPGTGKTWNTVARAVAILEGTDVEAIEKERKEQPGEVKHRFDLAREVGQVAMVTFHQNYAYEDFVEGIRPVLSEESETDVGFLLRRGVFRELAETADRNRRASQDRSDRVDVNGLIDSFLDFVRTGIENGEEFLVDVPGSKSPYPIVEVMSRGHGGIRLRGAKKGRKGLSSYIWRRDYQALLDGTIKKYQDIKPVHRAKTGWHFNARFHYAMLQRLEQYRKTEREPTEPGKEDRKNFVLILDEINRGNIARIFGELITLVEESRRIGRRDETKVTLPSSGEEFGVPENLYLIGTMNTADRSIALLDTALRRRFEFVEMMPDSSLLDKEVAEVHLGSLLDAMNTRIRFLRDREHQIGHTYFLEVSDLGGLTKVFQNRILPLLQEYFYDDWAKIEAVLGDNGFVKSVNPPPGLAGGDLVDADAKSYELLPFDDEKWAESASYRKIYEKSTGGSANDE